MATLRSLKMKTATCRRVVKELRSYAVEVEEEAAKTAAMKERRADPYDLRQQLSQGCHKRLKPALADLKATLAELKKSDQQGDEIGEAESTVAQVEGIFELIYLAED